MSPDGTRAISEDKFIFDGNDPAHPAITIEGPKVYKRDGFYYILAPAGGVRQGWQVALRSRNIEGPYEIRTVMDQGNSVINGPHQGGLVDTTDGEEWFLHFQDRGLFGRICHLQPVSWKDGWPVIGSDVTGSGCGEPVFRMKKPREMNPVLISTRAMISEMGRSGFNGSGWEMPKALPRMPERHFIRRLRRAGSALAQ